MKGIFGLISIISISFNVQASTLGTIHPVNRLTYYLPPCIPPDILPTSDLKICAGSSASSIGFQSSTVGAIFYWTKTSTAAGQATNIASSGAGNIPAYSGTNSGCTVLIDTIIVTPFNKTGPVDSCAGVPDTFLIYALPIPTLSAIRDSSFCHGQTWQPPSFQSTCQDSVVFHWKKKPGPGGTTLPGLALTGTGNMPLLFIINPPPSCLILTDTIEVTPYYKSKWLNDSCAGNKIKFIVKSVPSPGVNSTRDTAYCSGSAPAGFTFVSSCGVGTTIKWRKKTVGGPLNSGTTIAPSGVGNIPVFAATNFGPSIRIDTIMVNATFVSVGDSCIGKTDTFLICVLPSPSVNSVKDTTYCHGTNVPQINFTGPLNNTTYAWVRTGPDIGIPISGNDFIPMSIISNTTNSILTNTITVTPILKFKGVNCSGSPIVFHISAYPQPVAKCKNVTVYLNASGNGSISIGDVNNGSIGRILNLAPTSFNCTSVGLNLATLSVTDSCQNISNCISNITVLDTTRPALNCIDQQVNLQPSSCDTRFRYVPGATDNCGVLNVVAQDTAKYGFGKVITAGIHNVCFTAIDNSNNVANCCIRVQVNSFANPIGSLTCEDNVQISLDDKCSVTVSADYFLKGGPYRCYSEYKVLIQLWTGGNYIDRDPSTPGTQLNASDIGKVLKVTILDTVSGNSCWGKATVEDKLAPILKCPKDTIVNCDVVTTPAILGTPVVIENCGNYTLTYVDQLTKGNCTVGVDHWIRRTWTAIDNSGNKSYCSQLITVVYKSVQLISVPPDYNGFITPSGIYTLKCEDKYNPAFNLNAHLKSSPDCVDDYLLDNNIFIGTGRRVPRKLGWSTIPSGQYAGHPQPEPIYYPVHEDSTDCWKSNEIVMWEGTGKPLVGGCSNLAITFSDLVISTSKPNCNAGDVGCYKLLRTWIILDWCTGEVRNRQQIIKVEDARGPEISYPDTVQVNTLSSVCLGQWDVNEVWLSDNCSQDIHYTIRVNDGSVLGNEKSGYVVVDLPLGYQSAFIVAEDCCGNVTEKEVMIHVKDNTAPTAICQSKTIVSMTGNLSPNQNYTTVNALSFDDGSFDNCAPHVFYKVIRMDELNGTLDGSNISSQVCNGINGDDNINLNGIQTYFDDDVKFCCNDVGNVNLIVFRVFDVDPGKGSVLPARMQQNGDLFGHFSDCMVEVTVQNKVNPVLIPPSDVVVSCEYWFDINRLTDKGDSLFGKMVYDLAWRKKLVTNDIVCEGYCNNNLLTKYPGKTAIVGSAPALACDFYKSYFNSTHPDQKYELLWGFDGYLLSPCGANYNISIDDQRHCGQGKIIRTFSTTGQNGQVISASQTIWVVDCDPFYINRTDACDTLDDIVWPDCHGIGTYVFNCSSNVDLNNLGKPGIVPGADDHCSLIAIEHTDQIFTGEKDVCYVILRKWVVIDWCQYDPKIDPNIGRWEFTQFIKVSDREKPEVNCTIGSCEPAIKNSQNGICYGHISLTAIAEDICTPADWLSFEYKIDLFDDGILDYNVGTLSRKEYNNGDKPAIRNNPSADNVNNPFDASGNYPIGIHKIVWYVSDGCGNVGTCSKLFEVKDCKRPTPYCLPGIITVPMASSGCVDIWAKDLNFGSYDNCTPKDKLKLYFDGDTGKIYFRVCCEDFVKAKVNDELVIDVQVWVEDEEGNKDYCTSKIIVQDNQNICPNVGNFISISGLLNTPQGKPSANTTVNLYHQGLLIHSKSTGKDGAYSFSDLQTDQDYTIKPLRNDNPLNGISTADIVKIQKHILGKELMDSPYKIIAADVNNSNSITTADISEIRKLILGVIPTYSKVPSWKFVPASTEFEDIQFPWNYTTDFIAKMKSKSEKINFVAIKMGDVNESAISDWTSDIKERTSRPLMITADNQFFQKDQNIRIPYSVKDLVSMEGIQFTLNFNPALLQFKSFESASIQLNETNIGLSHLEKGIITLSFDSRQVMTFGPNDILFAFHFAAIKDGKLQHNMMITSDVTAAEYYNEFSKEGSVELNVRIDNHPDEQEIFKLLGSVPNPFKESTEIKFRLKSDSDIHLTIYDVTGKVVRIIDFSAAAGINNFKLNKNQLAGPGMYYFQLDANNESATGKLVLID